MSNKLALEKPKAYLPNLNFQLTHVSYVDQHLVVKIANRFNVESSRLCFWLQESHLTKKDLRFWIIAWILHEGGRHSTEIAQRMHLSGLFSLFVDLGERTQDILFALRMSEKQIVDLINRNRNLSVRQNKALIPFYTEMYAIRDANKEVECLHAHLKLASDVAVGLNGLSPLVAIQFKKRYSEILATLDFLFGGK